MDALRSLLEDAWSLAVALATGSVSALPLDDTARFLLLLVAGLGIVVIWSALGAPLEGHFAVLTLLLAGSALLLVLAGNLPLFYLAWEIAAVVCWSIGRLVNRGSDPVLGALPLQGIGGVASLAMFSGLLWLAVEGRTADFGPVQAEHLPIIAGLLIFAAFAKSLGVITQSWHQAAPRVGPLASVLLATIGVLCLGVVPLMRVVLGPLADAPDLVRPLLTIGPVLALVGALAALGERDVYRIASYTGLVQLGLFATALARPGAVGPGNLALLAPALWGFAAYCGAVAALYLALGNAERATGERSLTALGGLGRWLPLSALGALLAALALGGAPPFPTFGLLAELGRGLLDQPTSLALPGVPLPESLPLATGLFLAALVLQLVALLRLVGRVFGGRFVAERHPARAAESLVAVPREGPVNVLVAVLVLALGTLALGFQTARLTELLRPVVGPLAG